MLLDIMNLETTESFTEFFADNIRKSPYFIPELDLVAVTNEGFILGHGIFFGASHGR